MEFFTLQTARSDRNDSPITRHKKESPQLLLSCLIHWHLNKEFYCYFTVYNGHCYLSVDLPR